MSVSEFIYLKKRVNRNIYVTKVYLDLNIKNRFFGFFGFFLGPQLLQIFENADSFTIGLIKLHFLQVNS